MGSRFHAACRGLVWLIRAFYSGAKEKGEINSPFSELPWRESCALSLIHSSLNPVQDFLFNPEGFRIRGCLFCKAGVFDPFWEKPLFLQSAEMAVAVWHELQQLLFR